MAKERSFQLGARKLFFMLSLAVVCLSLFIVLSDPGQVLEYWSAPQQPSLHTVAQLYRNNNASANMPNASLAESTGGPAGATSTEATDMELTATRRLPQALIIGVKKGGTRALLEFLRLHPDVRAAGSEPHFFDRHYGRGLDWYRSLMPKALEGQIVMEKTPRYFVSGDSPARVHAMSRDVKLIVVVRDPITRAISDYAQIVSKTPSVASFESLSFRNGSAGAEVNPQWSPLWIGLYARHLTRWLAYFPLAQIHFVHGERLIADPAGEMAHVQDFLGLERIVTDKHFYFNQTKGFPCLKKLEGSSQPHCLGRTKGRAHPQIQDRVIRRLREFYRPHNLRFYEMLGQDFGWQ